MRSEPERPAPAGAGRSLGRLGSALLLLVIALTIAGLGAWSLRRGSSDFTVSLRAAAELSSGGSEIYHGSADHPQAFAYPHVVLMPLCGLLHLLSPRVIEVLFGASQGIAAAWLVFELLRIFGWIGAWRMLLFALLFGRAFTNNLQNGQFGLWCAALTTFGIRKLIAGANLAAGASLAGAAALKLTPLLFVPTLPLMKRAGASLALLASVLLLVVVAPWPFLGTTQHFATLHAFWKAMIAPLFGYEGSAVVWNNHSLSISGTFDHLFRAEPTPPGGTQSLCLVDLCPGGLRTIKIVWSLVLIGIASFGWRRSARLDTADPAKVSAMRSESLLLQCSLVLLLMALFSPQTKLYHFLASVLPAWWFCAAWPPRGRGRVLWGVTAILWAITLPLRQRALLGDGLWHALDELPFGHLAVVGLLTWVAFYARMSSQPTEPCLRS